eukprot:6298771-Amphidinium_carterae.1
MTGAKCIKARSLSRPMAFFEVDDGNATHFGACANVDLRVNMCALPVALCVLGWSPFFNCVLLSGGSRLAHPAWHQALVEIDAFMGANRCLLHTRWY